MSRSIAIIQDEHRSIAAVLHGLRYVVGEVCDGRAQPDFVLLRAMLRYLKEFPDRLHHPKEDDYLYRRLRQRDPASDKMLRGLEAEHVRGRDLTAHLFDALDAFEKAGAPAAPAFSDLLAEYAQFQWEHMRREEEDVLPRARRVMSEADWREVDAAFAANADPIAGVSLDREFRDLFHTIVNLAPPPIGVGPSARR